MRIYITHCSKKKDASLKHSNAEVTPDKLYKSQKTKAFMNQCILMQVKWAIFSDFYGVWFPEVKHRWYEKAPDLVTELEFQELINDFEDKLKDFDEIWFYHNPGRFHSLYKRLIQQSKLKHKIRMFTHIAEIV